MKVVDDREFGRDWSKVSLKMEPRENVSADFVEMPNSYYIPDEYIGNGRVGNLDLDDEHLRKLGLLRRLASYYGTDLNMEYAYGFSVTMVGHVSRSGYSGSYYSEEVPVIQGFGVSMDAGKSLDRFMRDYSTTEMETNYGFTRDRYRGVWDLPEFLRASSWSELEIRLDLLGIPVDTES